MKQIKIVAALFLVTCVTSLMNVKADSYLAFANITLKAYNKVYTTSSTKKTTISDQYVNYTSAYDNFSGDERVVQARLSGVTSSWKDLVKKTNTKLLSGTSSIGTSKGSFQLQLRAKKWTASSVSFSGVWYLDDYLL